MTNGVLRRPLTYGRLVGRGVWNQRHSSDAKILAGNNLGPVVENKYQTFRLRKDGTPLPLPPLLDPIAIDERSRWEVKKARPNVEKFTPFQKKFFENPYAHTLATPARRDRILDVNLPAAFLATFHARAHPETEEPWLLPVSLTTSKKHLGTAVRVVNSKIFIENINRRIWGRYNRLVEKLGSKVQKIIFREDMATLILSLMQKSLFSKLRWNTKQLGRLTPCASPRVEDIDAIDDVSCVLFFPSLKTPADDIQARAAEISKTLDKHAHAFAAVSKDFVDPHNRKNVTHHSPGWYHGPPAPVFHPRVQFPELEFPTTMWRGRKVPVYSLTDLLGEEMARGVVQGTEHEDKGCVVVRRGRHNVPMEMELLRLQGYLARPGPLGHAGFYTPNERELKRKKKRGVVQEG
ncbi:hypothetical protein P154DRAFT_453300 [Amniculicola lignicola CBS 123094]|uniref:Uncharacterized protein n=1 Tax=Amniculicola lignicola CBS 123094 TaxID=1392246 RepID=A0A6A5X4R9_9PLEO|nr:hypothetical protein P154DRAFT_453300 [Amniculicola lignicola CBS 123094]